MAVVVSRNQKISVPSGFASLQVLVLQQCQKFIMAVVVYWYYMRLWSARRGFDSLLPPFNSGVRTLGSTSIYTSSSTRKKQVWVRASLLPPFNSIFLIIKGNYLNEVLLVNKKEIGLKMTLYFITGNINKFNEIKGFIPEIKQIDIDLKEIQDIDPKKIIEEKLNEAIKENPESNKNNQYFCEDTSLEINSLNGLPGPFIKWFLKTLGNKGIYDLIKDKKDKSAIARTIIGYADRERILFFEGQTKGEIVEPFSDKGYGWDSIFKPNKSEKTFAEMSDEIRDMRKKALIKLKNYLMENKNENRAS